MSLGSRAPPDRSDSSRWRPGQLDHEAPPGPCAPANWAQRLGSKSEFNQTEARLNFKRNSKTQGAQARVQARIYMIYLGLAPRHHHHLLPPPRGARSLGLKSLQSGHLNAAPSARLGQLARKATFLLALDGRGICAHHFLSLAAHTQTRAHVAPRPIWLLIPVARAFAHAKSAQKSPKRRLCGRAARAQSIAPRAQRQLAAGRN